jgi:AcrR family transcriptional regulator
MKAPGSSPTVDVVPLRQQHSALTRRAILQAARQLYAERGFANTTVRELAEAAGVAVQTIYGTFGSKAGVMMSLVDLLDEEAGIAAILAEIHEAEDPRAILRLTARICRQVRERCGDIVRTGRQGAATDEGVAAALAEGLGRRNAGLATIIQGLHSQRALREGLDPQRAADIAAALASDEICDVLVDQRNWSYDDYERWLADALAQQLLR